LTATITRPGDPQFTPISLQYWASGDDAFPLAIDSGPAYLTASTINGSHGLAFNIDSIAGSADQTSVELHVGSVSNDGFTPVFSEFSWDSKSCLVVSQSNFLGPLEDDLRGLVDPTDPASVTNSELISWFAQDVDCTITSDDNVPQAQLNITNNDAVASQVSKKGPISGQFEIELTRSLEKDVMVLYTVTDDTTDQTTTREASISSSLSDPNDSVTISFDSLFKKGTVATGAPSAADVNSLINSTPRLQDLSGTFDTKLTWTPGQGYEVKYHDGSSWYFDSQSSASPSDAENESLMFGQTETVSFQATQNASPLIAQPGATNLNNQLTNLVSAAAGFTTAGGSILNSRLQLASTTASADHLASPH
jgi:hypothetical protein